MSISKFKVFGYTDDFKLVAAITDDVQRVEKQIENW